MRLAGSRIKECGARASESAAARLSSSSSSSSSRAREGLRHDGRRRFPPLTNAAAAATTATTRTRTPTDPVRPFNTTHDPAPRIAFVRRRRGLIFFVAGRSSCCSGHRRVVHGENVTNIVTARYRVTPPVRFEHTKIASPNNLARFSTNKSAGSILAARFYAISRWARASYYILYTLSRRTPVRSRSRFGIAAPNRRSSPYSEQITPNAVGVRKCVRRRNLRRGPTGAVVHSEPSFYPYTRARFADGSESFRRFLSILTISTDGFRVSIKRPFRSRNANGNPLRILLSLRRTNRFASRSEIRPSWDGSWSVFLSRPRWVAGVSGSRLSRRFRNERADIF